MDAKVLASREEQRRRRSGSGARARAVSEVKISNTREWSVLCWTAMATSGGGGGMNAMAAGVLWSRGSAARGSRRPAGGERGRASGIGRRISRRGGAGAVRDGNG